MADRYDLRLPALALRQGARWIYSFGIDGKLLDVFATVSRAHRDDSENLRGYQRPEVVAHIRSIRRYIESEGAMLPNAVVFAFSPDVRFESLERSESDSSILGELVIPVDEAAADAAKPAWIVDGQQRCAAIRDADVSDFQVAGVGFIAEDQAEQRSQFILVNRTKPLPKGLIHELLPDTSGKLPDAYVRRQLPASVLAKLNTDPVSPFYQIISTPTNPAGYIKDNSVLKMIENSLYEGALYDYRDPATGEGDRDRMAELLIEYWSCVRDTWPLAWRLPPRKSRLTHGVGIQALGYVMDLLIDPTRAPNLMIGDLREHLLRLQAVAAWTEGRWRLAPDDIRPWNGLQNTPRDIRQLTNLLVGTLHSDDKPAPQPE